MEGNLIGWGTECEDLRIGVTFDQRKGFKFREMLVYGIIETDGATLHELQGCDVGYEFPCRAKRDGIVRVKR
jgi:hypothetical protein